MSKDKITVNMNIHDIPIVIEELEKAQKEIGRLNNIINELEEIINYEIQEWKDTDDELMKARVIEDKHILDIIAELKDR